MTPGYFETLGIPLLRGRFLAAGDDRAAPPVVVINQALARRYYGRRPIRSASASCCTPTRSAWSTIVGIVGDVHGFGLDQPAHAEIYFPLRADARRSPA